MVEKKTTKAITLIVGYAALIICLLLCVYPLIWMVFGSLKTTTDFYTNVWGPPVQFIWENYVEAWRRADMTIRYINSFFITGLYLVIIIPAACCAAYSFARLRFKGRNKLYFFLLCGIMIPTGVLTLPLYSTMVSLGLINSRIGLAFTYAGTSAAFSTFMMRGFFISLPKSLEEAACIDGCTLFGAFRRVILPLTKPGIVILVIYNGLSNWTEYHLASLVLTNSTKQTVPVGMALFQANNAIQYPVLFAALALATIPMVIVYVLCQKSFISGMTAGAVKG